MADIRQRTTFGNFFRFAIRFLGLTGLIVAVPSLALLNGELPATVWPDGGGVREYATAVMDATKASIDGTYGNVAKWSAWVALVAIGCAFAWLIVETIGAFVLVTGRRTAVGGNAYLQIGLAIALLVLVNAWSFTHHKRYDLTRNQQFTLPQSVMADLDKLTGQTDIVVLQLHKTAGSLSAKPDALDFAAERKVVEKVKDLVELFRERGPQFRVTVLDVEEEGYEQRIVKLTENASGQIVKKELRAAIESAPENSIVFHSDGKVQRLSFSEFYLLDKTASRPAITLGDGKIVTETKNLVLLPQGVRPFADRVLRLGEKKPKVGLAVIHPYLSSKAERESFTASGLRKTLEANGFEVTDIVLKKWANGPPSAAADTYEEFELDKAERRYLYLERTLDTFQTSAKRAKELTDKARTGSLSEADAISRRITRQRIDSEESRASFIKFLEDVQKDNAESIAAIAQQLQTAGPQYQEVMKNERAIEARRSTDVKAKFAQAAADCDLLIVPRYTIMDLANGDMITPSLYNLNKDQASVVQEFVKAGKPVFALFGATAGETVRPNTEPDELEAVFNRFGIEFGSQTIIYEQEAQAAAERAGEQFGGSVDVPPLSFDIATPYGKKPNPVGEAFRLTARAVNAKLEVKKSGFRPVYLNSLAAAKLPFGAVIAQTNKDSWNEDKPIPERDYTPKFDPAKLDDPKKGTRDEERHGPFPVGIAVETPIPAEWVQPKLAAVQFAANLGLSGWGAFAIPLVTDPSDYAKALKDTERPAASSVRIVALGHGGLVVGEKLKPGEEKLLLHAINWQLKRDDRLPKDAAADEKWQYPRVELSPRETYVYRWGTLFGLPLLCVYFGLIALMTRKVR